MAFIGVTPANNMQVSNMQSYDCTGSNQARGPTISVFDRREYMLGTQFPLKIIHSFYSGAFLIVYLYSTFVYLYSIQTYLPFTLISKPTYIPTKSLLFNYFQVLFSSSTSSRWSSAGFQFSFRRSPSASTSGQEGWPLSASFARSWKVKSKSSVTRSRIKKVAQFCFKVAQKVTPAVFT